MLFSFVGEYEEMKVKNFVIPLKELLWNGKVSDVCERLLILIKKYPKALGLPFGATQI
jgi:hypothetical protein